MPSKGFSTAPREMSASVTKLCTSMAKLASMGTCAGVYVVYFCQERNIDLTDARLRVEFERNEQTHLVEHVRMHLDLPPGFPTKYRKAVARAAEKCTVKRNLVSPPRFTVEAAIGATACG